jgi:DNA-binding MarR family transcriptional regulator
MVAAIAASSSAVIGTKVPTVLLPDRLRRSTIFLLMQVVKRGQRAAQPIFGGEPLRFPHYAVLAVAAAGDAIPQRELAAALGTDASDLVTVLDELVEHGMAERAVDPADRRRRLVSVTPAGQAWLAERDRLAVRFDDELCAPLPDRGAALREQLARLLG